MTEEAFSEWMDMVTDSQLRSAHSKMKSFYRKWGDRVFWLLKDQQMQARYGKTFTTTEKATYIDRMLNATPPDEPT